MVDVSLLCDRMVHVWCWGGVGTKEYRYCPVVVMGNLSCFLNQAKTELLLQRLYAKIFLKDLTKVLNRTGGGA